MIFFLLPRKEFVITSTLFDKDSILTAVMFCREWRIRRESGCGLEEDIQPIESLLHFSAATTATSASSFALRGGYRATDILNTFTIFFSTLAIDLR